MGRRRGGRNLPTFSQTEGANMVWTMDICAGLSIARIKDFATISIKLVQEQRET